MGDGLHGSEDALADLACDLLPNLDQARVLVGGLGVGFTLAAVLRRLGPNGQATVAELLPAVVRWNREYMGVNCDFPLADKRASVHMGDVCDLVREPPALWSAILLDVDNGPDALTRPRNGWLYTDEGIQMAYDALEPRGVLGIWSAYDDDQLYSQLKNAGFQPDSVEWIEEGRPTPCGTGLQFLWIGQKP